MTGLVGTTDTQDDLCIDKEIDGISRAHLMPFGAQFLNARQGTRFRIWAPSAQSVTLALEESSYRLHPQEHGWYELTLPEAGPGTLYQYRINQNNGAELLVPDPASRYQPKDVHAPSQVINPAEFRWQDTHWRGRPWEESVIYELHVGAFSPERSFQGVQNKLDYLADLGVTAIELMPIADFPGTRNWGYDGVLPYAPDSRYGTPNELKELIQAAHARGMMVFLDVVYNHLGPEGNYLHAYANSFFDEEAHTPWGAAINFSGNHLSTSQTRSIREFFIHNALYWLEEYHFDGLRLDAVHAIEDQSPKHFLDELAETIRDNFPQDRHIHLILENNHNQERLLKPSLYNAQWNDDFHHAAHVLLTGEKTGYYADYTQEESPFSPVEHLARCLTEGFAYQGEKSTYHGACRGESSKALPSTAFVNFLQNHDQIGNRALGERLNKLTSPAALKAAVSILLLSPGIPLLFMGEEWETEKPFLFFCDFEPELAEKVREGRKKEFATFKEFSNPEILKKIPDATAYRTFEASSLDWREVNQPPHNAWRAFYKHLLEIRQTEILPKLRDMHSRPDTCYQILGATGLTAQWHFADQSRLILLANLGEKEIHIPSDALPQPLTPIWQSNHQIDVACQTGKLPPWSVLWAFQGEAGGESQ